MDDSIETFQVECLTVKIKVDDDPQDPRECDNLARLVCLHRRYTLGDKHSYKESNYDGWDDILDAIREDTPLAAVLPLYLYDHGGISMSTGSFNDRWDSGRCGWAFVTLEVALKEYGWKKITPARVKKLEEYIRNEVKEYDQYLRGDVYGYVIEDEDGERLDSCWGYYGIKVVTAEATSAAKSEAEAIRTAAKEEDERVRVEAENLQASILTSHEACLGGIAS